MHFRLPIPSPRGKAISRCDAATRIDGKLKGKRVLPFLFNFIRFYNFFALFGNARKLCPNFDFALKKMCICRLSTGIRK